MEANKELKPKLRFKEFTDNWRIVKLGDRCRFTQGVQIPQSEQISYMKEGYIRYLYIRDFFTDKFKCYIVDKYPDKIIKDTEIMVVNTGNTAGEVYTGVTGVLSNNSFKIGFNHDEIHYKFLYLFLKSSKTQSQIRKYFNSGGQPHLGHSNIALIKLKYPKFEEQARISSFFTIVDSYIENLKQQKEALEKYKKGMMRKIFSRQFRFKDENGEEFPEWEGKKLGSLDVYISDGNYGEQYPSANEMKDSGIPFIRANNIKGLKIVWEDMRFIEKSKHILLESGHLKTGDILVTTRGEIGMLAYVNEEFEDANINAQICLLRFGNEILSKYILYFLSTSEGQKQFKELQTGSALKQLPKGNLSKLLIPIPDFKEQNLIAQFLSKQDELIEAKQQQIEKAEQWKKGLLQQLFI